MIRVKFWGVRGSIPCPGRETMHYGGNTACIELRFPEVGRHLIIDAGSGIRELGSFLVANDLAVTHLRGVSSRRRPAWVEFQKHRGLWRYFRKFEAAHVPAWQRPLVFVALWLHFPLALLTQAWQRRRQAGKS